MKFIADEALTGEVLPPKKFRLVTGIVCTDPQLDGAPIAPFTPMRKPVSIIPDSETYIGSVHQSPVDKTYVDRMRPAVIRVTGDPDDPIYWIENH